LLLFVCLAAVASADRMGSYHDMKLKFDRYNLFTVCFGPKITYQYFKQIRDANENCKNEAVDVDVFSLVDPLTADDDLMNMRGLLGMSEMGRFSRNKRDVSEFKEIVSEHKSVTNAKLGRLSCVLKKMGVLDQDNNFNMWTFEVMKAKMADTPIGKDDEALRRMESMISDCKDISEAWPQKNLDRNPLLKVFGRKRIYFECRDRGLVEVCYKWQFYEAMKNAYGIDTATDEIGLYGDKFDKAKAAYLHAFEHMDEASKYVIDFFWSPERE